MNDFVVAVLEGPTRALAGDLHAFQLAVQAPNGEIVAAAAGDDACGEPIEPGALFATYCAGKVALIAVTVALVSTGELSIDDRLGDLTPAPLDDSIAALSVIDVLNHSAGLSHVAAGDVLTVPPDQRRPFLYSQRSTGVSACPEYVDEASWSLLQCLYEDLTEIPIEQLLDDLVLAPLDALGEVFISSRTPYWDSDRLRINATLIPPHKTRLPLLWERSAHKVGDPAAGTSVVASCSGLLKLLRFVETSSVYRNAPVTALCDDPVLARPSRYQLGLMKGLADQGFGAHFSEESVGHTGLHGMTSLACDGEEVAFVYHEFCAYPYGSTHGETAYASERRRKVCSRLRRDLLAMSSGAVTVDEFEKPPT
jgi:CubicO group peptidase (beta-lactamase class C family)